MLTAGVEEAGEEVIRDADGDRLAAVRGAGQAARRGRAAGSMAEMSGAAGISYLECVVLYCGLSIDEIVPLSAAVLSVRSTTFHTLLFTYYFPYLDNHHWPLLPRYGRGGPSAWNKEAAGGKSAAAEQTAALKAAKEKRAALMKKFNK